jgi:hypothetical protein
MRLGLRITLISWFLLFLVKLTTIPLQSTSHFVNIMLHCTTNHCKQPAGVLDSHWSSSIDKSSFELTTLQVSFFLIFPMNSIKTKSNCLFLNIIQADIKIKHSLLYYLKPFFLISSIIQQIIATACDLHFACVDLDGFKQSCITNNNTTALVICYPLLIQRQNLMKHHHSSCPFYFVWCSFEKKLSPWMSYW